MMLLMGMKSSFTRYPIPPMIANPIAQLVAIFLNSTVSGFSQTYMKRRLASPNCFTDDHPSSISFCISIYIKYTHVRINASKSQQFTMRQSSLLQSFLRKQKQTSNESQLAVPEVKSSKQQKEDQSLFAQFKNNMEGNQTKSQKKVSFASRTTLSASQKKIDRTEESGKRQSKAREIEITTDEMDQFTDKTPQWALPENHLDKNLKQEGDEGYDPSTLYIPEGAKKQFTQAMKQYWQIKSQNYDKVILFKLGKFYELFYEDALIGNKEMQLKWMGSKMHVGFPEKCLDKYCEILVQKGYKTAVVQQLENPAQMKNRIKEEKANGRKSEATLARGVVEILSKGTIVSENQGDQNYYLPTYLISVVKVNSIFAFSLLDMSRNLILLGHSLTLETFKTMLYQTRPVQLIYDPDSYSTEILDLAKNSFLQMQMTRVTNKNNLWHPLNARNEISSMVKDGSLKPQRAIELLDEDSVGEYIYSTLSGLFRYLKECLKYDNVMGAVKFQMFSELRCQYMILDSQALQHLQIFDTGVGEQYSLFRRIDRTSTSYGRRLLRKWLMQPLRNQNAIKQRLNAVEDLQQYSHLRLSLQTALKTTPDLERIVHKLYRYSTKALASKAVYFEDVSATRLRQFKDLLSHFTHTWRALIPSRSILNNFKSHRLRQLLNIQHSKVTDEAVFFQDNEQIADGLLPNIEAQLGQFNTYLSWDGDKPVPQRGILVSYDSLLDETEQAKTRLTEYLNEIMEGMGVSNIKYVHTKERYEIEIPEEKEKRRPPDMIFTSKRAGFSRYVTKQSRRLVTELQGIEEKLKEQMQHFVSFFFDQFRRKQPIWQRYICILTEIDCLISLSVYSQQLNGVRPQFCESGYNTIQARHPCLSPTDFIANDIDLTDKRVLLLTGPNMGGKSTLLRTTCLLTILAQIGSYVPAQYYHCQLIDRIFTRIGASDKLSEGKSTFFVEMQETKTMLQYATPKSLLIIDELGRGTGTFDGMAIATAILNSIIKIQKPRCLFSTHYHALSEQFQYSPTVKLGVMDYVIKDEKLIFLYKLKEGCSEKSFALNVAKSVNIPISILQTAIQKSAQMDKQIDQKTRIMKFKEIMHWLD